MGSIGILLLATGHQNYYRMAVNLAASIKRHNAQVDISCVIDASPFPIAFSPLIDKHFRIPSMLPGDLKTRIYELSPYDRTLYLDVDMIMLPDRDITELFTELDGVPFTVMNTCAGDDYSVWVDATAIRSATQNVDDPLPAYYSELMYFEKCEYTASYFEKVRYEYVTSELRGKQFAGGMADELAFILASMKGRIFPHKLNWLPIFWHFRDRKDTGLQPYQLAKKYYGYSLGGNRTPPHVKAQYDNLVSYYAQVMKVTKPYKAVDKRMYLSNRSKI